MKTKVSLNIVLLLIALLLLLSISITSCSSPSNQPEINKTISIYWAEWAPADYLEDLGKDFTKETGIQVEVTQEPWVTYPSRFQKLMQNKSSEFDIVVGDSQWLGQGAKNGYYAELTVWLEKKGILNSMTEPSVKGYAEFPKGSKRYWAIPTQGDAMGFAYRKDLFENEEERARFFITYGYELDVPKTTDQLRDIAEFFNRPHKNLHGISLWNAKEYDSVTMGAQTFIWAYGGALGNEETYEVVGVLDSEDSIKGLEYYKELFSFSSPELSQTYLISNEALIQGKVAITMNYFAFFSELVDKTKNPYWNVTGFFEVPSGPKRKVTSLGGQGMSLTSFSKNKENSLQFMEWFAKEETQKKWAKLGGYPCNKNVLNSDEFLKATPFNSAFGKSMTMLKDFWAEPMYSELLEISQKYWYEYMTSDNTSAQSALHNTADEWEKIFERERYYKE